MWWILGLGVAGGVIGAFLFDAPSRVRAYRAVKDFGLRIDEFEGQIAQLSARLTSTQKTIASQRAVDARAEAKTLEEEARDLLDRDAASQLNSGRPSLYKIPRRH